MNVIIVFIREKYVEDFSKISIKAGAMKVSNAQSLKPQTIAIHEDYQVCSY